MKCLAFDSTSNSFESINIALGGRNPFWACWDPDFLKKSWIFCKSVELYNFFHTQNLDFWPIDQRCKSPSLKHLILSNCFSDSGNMLALMLISFQFQIPMTLCYVCNMFQAKSPKLEIWIATGLMQIDSNFSKQLADWADLSYVLRLPFMFIVCFGLQKVEKKYVD